MGGSSGLRFLTEVSTAYPNNMTLEKAKTILGEAAQGRTDEEITSWIASAEGLTVVFFEQLEQGLIKPHIDNE